MPPSISIPYYDMRWIIFFSDISEEDKCMFSRYSLNRFSTRSLPIEYSISLTSITDIFSSDRKKSEPRFIEKYESIFIFFSCAPISPEYDTMSLEEAIDHVGHFFFCIKTFSYSIAHDSHKSKLFCYLEKWSSVDSISCHTSLTPCKIPDKFFIRIAPYATPSIVWYIVDRKLSDNIIFRYSVPEISENHLECCYLAGELVVLEFCTDLSGYIVCWLEFPYSREAQSGIFTSEYATVFLLFLELWIFHESCFCEYILTRSNPLKWYEKERYTYEMKECFLYHIFLKPTLQFEHSVIDSSLSHE